MHGLNTENVTGLICMRIHGAYRFFINDYIVNYLCSDIFLFGEKSSVLSFISFPVYMQVAAICCYVTKSKRDFVI